MKTPSPRAHIYRLAFILLVGGATFVFVRGAMVPDTWNQKRAFREAALPEIAAKPMKYGGVASCAECHEDEDEIHELAYEDLAEGPHSGIACETCHGPLSEHVKDGKKFADATTNFSRLACLTCHSNLISTPPQFPMFITEDDVLTPRREAELLKAKLDAGKSKIFIHPSDAHNKVDCTECHFSFHNPETS
ncbi:MAG: hypothetical protein AAF591_07950 [Verrucomicrobiota bacterium]